MRARTLCLASIALFGALCVGVYTLGAPGLRIESATAWVQFVEPGAGATLTPGGRIQLRLVGLTPEEAGVAHIVVSARPQGSSGDGAALFRCNGQAWVPLQGCGATGGMLWLYDAAARVGTLQVSWNAAVDLRGAYSIRAEVMLKYTPSGGWGLWRRTEWVTVILESGKAPDLVVVVKQPVEGAVFTLGQQVPIEVVLSQSTFFRWLRLEVTGPTTPGESTILWEGPASGTTTGTAWNALAPLPGGRTVSAGEWTLVAVGISDSGAVIRSEPRKIRFTDRLSLRMLVDGAVASPGGTITVTAGRAVNFCADGEVPGQLQSFSWDFGGGSGRAERCVAYTFGKSGTNVVRLTAFTEPGWKGSAIEVSAVVHVRDPSPEVTVTREVLGFPDPCNGRMTVLPGHAVYVRLRVTTWVEAVVMTVQEILPDAWQVDNETRAMQDSVEILAVVREQSKDRAGHTIYTWVVAPERHMAHITSGAVIEIVYLLTPPKSKPKPGDDVLNFTGHVRMTSREGDVATVAVWDGWISLAVVDRVSIPVLVAHLEGGTLQPMTFSKPVSERYVITEQQFEEAKRLLGREVVLPGHLLTAAEMERVILYYKAKRPVSECLAPPDK